MTPFYIGEFFQKFYFTYREHFKTRGRVSIEPFYIHGGIFPKISINIFLHEYFI